jgi:hypothetical protein
MKRRKKSKAKRYPKRRSVRRNFHDLVDYRGNSYDRRRRKNWLLKTYGDGTTVKCVHCDKQLDYDTLTVDRKDPLGRYTYANIQPSCLRCNTSRSRKLAPTGSMQHMAMVDFVAAERAKLAAKKKMANNPKLRYKTIKRGRRGILRGYHKSFWRRSA